MGFKVKYDNIYMWVVLTIVLNFFAGRYIIDFVNKTSRDKGRACANGGNGAIGYRRIIP